jgi:putative aldouronate transport system substrate-binding protein
VYTVCFEKNQGNEEIVNQDYMKFVIAFPTMTNIPEDLLLVQEEINKITRSEMGIEVELKVFEFREYRQALQTRLIDNKQLDVVLLLNHIYAEANIRDQLVVLNNIIEQNGKGIIDVVGKNTIEACKLNGKIYGVPNIRGYATGYDGYVLRKDLVDKYKIDVKSIKTIKDLEDVFEIIKSNEPDLTVLVPGTRTLLYHHGEYDKLGGNIFGVLPNYGQDDEIIDLFETQKYMESLEMIRRWYLKGYLQDDILTDSMKLEQKITEGKIFAYTQFGKPGVAQQEQAYYGVDMDFVQIGETAIGSEAISKCLWGITKNTISQEKSMQLLNLLYTNSDIMNLLCYGIEGKHYVFTDDTHIKQADNLNREYTMGNTWSMPNQFITHIWEGNSLTVWDDLRTFQEGAIKSKGMGFIFDIVPVYKEYIAVQKTYNEYSIILENGLVDPKVYLPKMREALEQAGLESIIIEKRRQYEKWKLENINR